MILNQTLAGLDPDRRSLPQRDLDLPRRERTNPLRWIGQFSPQLVERLLGAYAPRDGVLLDPFVGSGTTLVEAARLNMQAYGAEINPAAVTLADVYRFANETAAQRHAVTHSLHGRLFPLLTPPIPTLFSRTPPNPISRAEMERALLRAWRTSPSTSEQRLAAALVVLCDFHRRRLDTATLQSVWHRLRHTVHNLPYSSVPIDVLHADARSLPLPTASVDFVLTSPPYINVHNYHQQYRRSTEALAHDVLAFARSEIGSNRSNRGNRFLTVVQYALDIALALREVARVTRPGTLSIFVVGRESSVQGVRFFNGELVAEVAVQAVGMRLERRQERVFRNRYGKRIVEDILHFRSPGVRRPADTCLTHARRIAGMVLSTTLSSIAPHREEPRIRKALERLPAVSPSPAPDVL